MHFLGTPPHINAESWYDRFRQSRSGSPEIQDLLDNAKLNALEVYGDYEAAAPNVHTVIRRHFPAEQLAALHDTYGATRTTDDLREELTKRALSRRCPLCGADSADTLDHYLPKSKFKEFSIFPLNLVPCCGSCNRKKLTRIVEEGRDVRLFLHPYYDQIPDFQMLHAEIKVDYSEIITLFRLDYPRGMNMEIFDHIHNHFRLLQLASKYARLSITLLKEEYAGIQRRYSGPRPQKKLSAFLNDAGDDYAISINRNNWRSVLYRALAKSDPFCNGGFEAIERMA